MGYWFGRPVILTSKTLMIYLVIFGLIILLGIVFKSVASKGGLEKFVSKILSRWGSLFLTMGFLGLVYVWLRYERAPWISYRCVLGLWGVVLIWWAYKISYYQKKKVPKLRERHIRDAQRYAYLPKNK